MFKVNLIIGNFVFLLAIVSSAPFAQASAFLKTTNRPVRFCGEFETGTDIWKRPSITMYRAHEEHMHFVVDEQTLSAFVALRTPFESYEKPSFGIYYGHPDCACVTYTVPAPVHFAEPWANIYFQNLNLIGQPSACPKPLPARRL